MVSREIHSSKIEVNEFAVFDDIAKMVGKAVSTFFVSVFWFILYGIIGQIQILNSLQLLRHTMGHLL